MSRYSQQRFRPEGQELIDGATLQRRMAHFEAEVRDSTNTEHYWVFTQMHRITEEQAASLTQIGGVMTGIMDHETLVMAGGPICYRCETTEYTTDPCHGYRDVIREEGR